MVYLVNGWQIQPNLNKIITGTKKIKIEPRTMLVLVYLIERAGKVISREELLQNVWKNIAVNDESLTHAISDIRKAFKENPMSCEVIETVRSVGYRFTGDTKEQSLTSLVKPQKNLLGYSALFLTALIGFVLANQFILPSLFDSPENSPSKQTPNTTLPLYTIAVIPFADLSEQGNQAYFANGLSEELMGNLSKVTGLRVTAKMSSYAVRERTLSIPEIGKALNVGTIVEGSVRLDGSQVRVSAQLVDADSGFQIWSQTYKRELSGLFELQDEISRAITSALLPELNKKAIKSRIQKLPQYNPEAYLLYLKGQEALRGKTFQAIEKAIDYYNTALELDPNFIEALNELAFAKISYFQIGASNALSLLIKAEELLDKAINKDRSNGRTFFIMYKLRNVQSKHRESIHFLKMALNSSPDDPLIKAHLAIELIGSNPIEAERLFTQALQLDPLNVRVRQLYGLYLSEQGDIDAAVEALHLATVINPENPDNWWDLTVYHIFQGELSSSYQHFEKALQSDRFDHELIFMKQVISLSLGVPTSQLEALNPKRQGSQFVDTFAATVQALRHLNDKEYRQAMQVARSVFENSGIQFRHNTKELLTRIITNELLRSNQASQAEKFLIKYNKAELDFILNSPKEANYFQRFRLDNNLRTILAYADIQKTLKNYGQYERVMNTLEVATISNMKKYRKKLKNRDYLVEAEIRAIRGDNEGALEMLEKAISTGFRFRWQLEILENASFRNIKQNPKFIRLIELVRDDMRAQKNALSGIKP